MNAIDQFRRSFAIAKKDMLIFYLKGPVVIMGLLFPFFLFLAFLIGRNLGGETLFAGLVGMTVFFTSTAVGPTIVPWECRGRTFERLITAPVSLTTVLLGDFQASFYFGLGVSLAVSVPTMLYLGIHPGFALFLGSTLLALACFSAMAILMSSYPPTDVPADVMMLSSLVKFSLLFISGIFVPLDKLPAYGRAISLVSPLTYYVDAVKHSLGEGYLPVWIDLMMLAIFAVAFFLSGSWVHNRVLERRFT
ncbi:ABC transporter permease [Thermococcus peptonophilus]|uniref:ABC transporter n=1 Tax=Thermococcus peptonophilus TaxID=53952 RepID=A0A142CX93_9EURY|nr:ABC transporter permease [Thermococcus peptonophilus]AMQ19395.1 ABC transporter [Thermococcus peptonophilus]